jgi:hypothetical protein
MKKLLTLKELTPQDKIIIITINDNLFFGECKMTSAEIGAATGLPRKKVIDSLTKLIEIDYIICKVDGRFNQRITTFTDRLKYILK